MSALGDLQKMILWCRKNGVAWDSLTVGGLTINGSDCRLAEGLPQQPATDSARVATMFQRYGGDLLAEAAKSPGMTSVVEEIDD